MLSKAAVKGSGAAWDAMAHMYSSGKGEMPSESRAVECWRKGAELKHAPSMYSLAQRLHDVSHNVCAYWNRCRLFSK
jgi:TPR repeat protein